MIKKLIDHELELLNKKATAYESYKRGNISYGQFVLEYMEIEEKSSMGCPKAYVMDWLIDQKTNDLPITSSGSTLNAILDEDGLTNALEDEEDEWEDKLLLYSYIDYISEEIDAIRTRIRCNLREVDCM